MVELTFQCVSNRVELQNQKSWSPHSSICREEISFRDVGGFVCVHPVDLVNCNLLIPGSFGTGGLLKYSVDSDDMGGLG